MIYLSGLVVEGIPSMVTPAFRNRVPDGQAWAADTGCFANPDAHDDERYLAWLDLRPRETCLFATAPDRLGDAELTLALARPMLPRIRALGFRAALVAQNGLERLDVPWDEFDVLFIGGTDEWKHSEACRTLIREARRRDKWVHVGRVNGYVRLRWAKSVGASSVDGTFLVFGPDVNRARLEAWMERLDRELLLPLE